MIFVYGRIYIKYDTGYLAANYLNAQRLPLMVVDYNVNSLTLEFHSRNKYLRVGGANPSELKELNKPYYMLLKIDDLPKVKTILGPNTVSTLTLVHGATIDIVLHNLLSRPRLEQELLTHYVIIKIE
jgi:hypothetical protein